MERLKEIEALLIQCEEDLKKIRKFQKEFKEIEANRKQLDEYYKNQYMADYENHSNEETTYRILNQDSIWNVLSDQYQEKINLLKSVVKSI